MNSLSLKDHVDEDYVADSILLEKDDALAKALLLVEGQDDEYVYRRLVCCTNCKVVREDGDDKLIKAIKKHNSRQTTGVLAILDSHFDNIRGRILPQNVFTTDGYDLESMILCTRALEDFVGSRVIGKDEESVEEFMSHLRIRLFELGAIIGYLRFKSQECSWADKINVHVLLRQLGPSCERSFNEFVERLKDSDANFDEAKVSQLELQGLIKNHLSDLCRGHDMVHILSIIFAPLSEFHLGKRVNPGAPLAEQLLAIFNPQHFRSTDLHRKIKAWQEDNKPYMVLHVH